MFCIMIKEFIGRLYSLDFVLTFVSVIFNYAGPFFLK